MVNAPPRGPPPVSPSHGRFLMFAIAGLVLGFVLQEWRWRPSSALPQDNLHTAENALRSGDDQTAIAIFRKLADQNVPTAQYWLAHIDELGLGVPRDTGKAIELYKKAAAQNVTAAQSRLGEIYLHGDISPPDFVQAKSYLEEAAYHGDDRAAMLLGQMFRLGLGVAANTKEAYAWSEVAAVEGSIFARRERDASVRDLSVDDQKAAVAAAQDILKEIKQRTAVPQAPSSK